jgi:transcriptional regulator with XRE-family HTH domain
MSRDGLQKFGEIVRTARGDMSRAAFGKFFGVSYQAIARWESGEVIPDSSNLAKLAVKTGYTMIELQAIIDGRSLPKPDPVQKIIREVERLPIEDVAKVLKASADRLASMAS